MLFEYKAAKKDGSIVEGKIEAKDEEKAEKWLREHAGR